MFDIKVFLCSMLQGFFSVKDVIYPVCVLFVCWFCRYLGVWGWEGVGRDSNCAMR